MENLEVYDKENSISPENKTLGAPKGLKGLSFGEAMQQMKQQTLPSEEEIAADRLRYLGRQQNIVSPDITNINTHSKFDKRLGDYYTGLEFGEDINDLRGNQQTKAGVWLNSLINNVAIAGSTAVLGTLGLVDGIIETIATGENRMGNNTMSRAQDDFLKFMDENVPVYRGQAYENKSLFSKMGTAVFWGDFLKNLGYTEGMLIPGMGAAGAASKVSRLFNAGAKTTEWVSRLTGSIVGAMTEAATEATSNSENQKQYKINLLNDKFRQEMGLAGNSQEEMYRLYTEKQKALDTIDEDALKTSNFIFWSNAGLLTITNLIEFGNLFGKSYDSGRRVLTNNVKANIRNAAGEKTTINPGNLEELLTKGNVKNIAFEGLPKGKEIARVTAKKIADSVSEGFEEFSQGVISHRPEIGTDYNLFNESVLNPEKKELVDGFMEGWFKSLTDYLEDPNASVETMMGFLTGLLGAPTYVRGRGITWGNGVITEIHNAAREGRISNKVASQLNDMIEHISSDEKFLARYKGLLRSVAMEDTKNNALERGDKVDYKNAESAQFISDVETFRKAGQVDMFKKIFETMSDMSDEDIQSIISTTTDENGNGPFSKNGKADSIEDVRNTLKERSERYIRNINRIVNDAEKLENNLSLHVNRLSDDEFNTLLYLKEQGYNFNERIFSMLGEIGNAINPAIYKELVARAEQHAESYDNTVKEWNEKSKQLQELNKLGIENGSYNRYDISTLMKKLRGEQVALDETDTDLLTAVVKGSYAYFIPKPDNIGKYSVVHPEDFEKLIDEFSKVKKEFIKQVEESVDKFKNSKITEIAGIFNDNDFSYAWLKSALKESDIIDNTTESLGEIQQLLKDVVRVTSSAEYYNKEYNNLYKKYTEEVKKRTVGGRIKEKAEEAVDKVTQRRKASKIKERKKARGEDVSGKSDEEIINEDAIDKDNADIAKSEFETVKNKIVDSLNDFTEEDKKLVQDYINDFVSPILKTDEDASQQELKDRYSKAIDTILDHDNYSSLELMFSGEPEQITEKVNKVKDTVRNIHDTRNNFKERTEIETEEEEDRDSELFARSSLEQDANEKDNKNNGDNNVSPKEPLDYLTNSVPEVSKEIKESNLGNVPLYSLTSEQQQQLKKKAWHKENWDDYVKNVNFLYSAGAYSAVIDLLAPMFKEKGSNRIPVKFMMLNTPIQMFEKEKGNPDSRLHKIFHVLDVTNNTDWVNKHNTQLFEYKGRKYQIIGQQAENVATSELESLNKKLREESKGKFENNIWVSDSETFLTKMIRGELNLGQRTIGTESSNIGNVLKDNAMSIDDFVLGVVVGEGEEKRVSFINEEGKIEEMEPGDAKMKSGAYMLLSSSDPNLYRLSKLYIPFFKDYFANNPNSQFTNMIVDTFSSLAEEAIKNPGEMDSETVRILFNTIHNLIYFGKEGVKGNINVRSFDKGDGVDVVIGIKADYKDVKENTQLHFAKNDSKEDIRKTMRDFVLGRFTDIISSDAFSNENEEGKKYPIFRISMVAPKQYKNGSTSIGNAVAALGLKGNANTAYKQFIVDNNLLQTDLGSTREVNAGYALAKYDPKTDSFVKGDDSVRKPKEEVLKPEPEPQIGTETTQKIDSVELSVPIKLLSEGKQGNIKVKASIENGNLTVKNKEGKNLNSIFDKVFRETLQKAMETNSALPAIPEFYTLRESGNLYIAYYNSKGELEVTDQNYDFIEDKVKKATIRELFRNKLNPKPETPVKEAAIPVTTTSLVENLVNEEDFEKGDNTELSESEMRGLQPYIDKYYKDYKTVRRTGLSEEEALANILKVVKEDSDKDAEYNYIEKCLKERIQVFERGKKYTGKNANAKIARELTWLNKAIPQAGNRTRIVKGFVKMLSDPTGLYIGKFMNSAIYLSEDYAVKGTVYHEAFHFVFNALLNPEEQAYLLRNAKNIIGESTSKLDTEEWLADMFADYVGKKESRIWNNPIGRSIARIFEWLKEILGITSSNRKRINDAFNSIYEGEFAERDVNEISVERGKMYSEKIIVSAMIAVSKKIKEADIIVKGNKVIITFTDNEEARNSYLNKLLNYFRLYPVKVASFTPAELHKIKTGSKEDINQGHQSGIMLSFDANKARWIENEIKKDEEFLQYSSLKSERKTQLVDVAYDITKGEISREELENMSENALETLIHCR